MEFVTAKGVFKTLVSPVIDLCGIYDALLARRVFAQPNWLILMYHRIIDTPAADPFHLGMCVDRAYFAEQIDFLTRIFTPITVEDAALRLRQGLPLPRNAMSVTFDDGYQDFVELALPVLRRYGCPATIYVSTGGIETRERFWWDRVIESFAGTRRSRLDLDIPAKPGGQGDRSLRLGLGNRRRALIRTLDALWNLSAAELEPLVATIELELGERADVPKAKRLGLDDIATFDPQLVEVAVHGEQHVDMTLRTADDLVRDINESRRRLEEATGRKLTGFAYPGGRQDAATRQLVHRAGFSYAAGTQKGLNRQPFESFNLRRIGMPNTTIPDFKRCLSAAAGTEQRTLPGESVQWP